MRTVKEVSRLTGVSVRTLHYYDSIDLLRPTQITNAGYRLYDDKALERLQLILLFRELQFSLKEIREILKSPDFERNKALEQQITLLTLRREHLQNLITLARGIQLVGVNTLDFSAFDTKKIDEYAAQAKATWGKTEVYREFEEKNRDRTPEQQEVKGKEMMDIFRELGEVRHLSPESDSVQALIQKLRQFITENWYTCTPEIFSSLGKMYAGGGAITENIDQSGGTGTAEFTSRAIEIYCNTVKK